MATTRRLSRDEKRARTRADILEAAARVFPERGFHRASLEEVAEEAGLSTGAVYSNFAGKADLFLAVYERYMTGWVRRVDRLLSEGEGALGERTLGGVRHWLDYVHHERRWFLLFIEFWAYAVDDADLRPRFAVQFRRLREAIVRTVDRGAKASGLELPLPAESVGAIVNALGNGLLLEMIVDPEAVTEDLYPEALGLLFGHPRLRHE